MLSNRIFESMLLARHTETADRLAEEAAVRATVGRDNDRYNFLKNRFFALYYEIELIELKVKTKDLNFLHDEPPIFVAVGESITREVQARALKNAEEKAANMSGNSNWLYSRLKAYLLPYYIMIELIPLSDELHREIDQIISVAASELESVTTQPSFS